MIWALVLFVSCANCQIVFPGTKESKLPIPEKCENGKNYCGGEESKYPIDKIKAIVERTIEIQKSLDNKEHFFRPLDNLKTDDNEVAASEQEPLETACKSRKELIPRFSRAKNVVGKWVYLVEGAGDQRQEVEVIICEDVDKPCDNDSDSPHGEGTTVCKQLFRTQKMLAIDNDNEVVVDTFELPSACVCNYRREELGLRNLPSTQVDDDTFRNLECGKSQVTAPLSTRYVRYDDEKQIEQKMALLKSGRNLFERKESDDLPEPKPCKQGNLTDDSNVRFGELCIDSSESGYPESLVKSAIRKHNTLRSPVHFKKLFDRPCEYERPTTAFRVGLSFQESPLCTGYQSYIFPKIAKTVKGEWKYIINTDEYRQGVTVEVCHFPVKDQPCRYGGAEGNFPEATICKQKYTRHNMLAITSKTTLQYETFKIPSACVCHLKDSSYFDLDYR